MSRMSESGDSRSGRHAKAASGVREDLGILQGLSAAVPLVFKSGSSQYWMREGFPGLIGPVSKEVSDG